MATSIFHRATGAALYGGAFLLTGWLLALAMGPEAYEAYAGLLGSILGQIVLFGFTVAMMYHLANGVRHLIWDAGHGYKKEVADLSAWVVIVFGVLAAVAIWAFILLGA